MLKAIALSIVVSIFNKMNPENYLNKRIENIFPLYKNHEINKIPDSDTRTYRIEEEYIFFEKKTSYLSVTINNYNIIQRMYLTIDEQIDKKFFNKLKDHYGEPDYMFKMGEIIHSDMTVDTDGALLGSGFIKGKPCSFEEKPICIAWSNQQFTMEIEIDYYKKITTFICKSVSKEDSETISNN